MRVNLIINQGETYQTTFTVMDGDAAANLSGFTASALMKKHYSSNTSYEFSANVVANAGQVILTLSANTSESIEPGRYAYDCFLTSNTGVRSKPFEGTVTVMPGISL